MGSEEEGEGCEEGLRGFVRERQRLLLVGRRYIGIRLLVERHVWGIGKERRHSRRYTHIFTGFITRAIKCKSLPISMSSHLVQTLNVSV